MNLTPRQMKTNLNFPKGRKILTYNACRVFAGSSSSPLGRLGGAIIFIAFISSCSNDPKLPGYEYMGNTDMYRSPSYETYSPNPNFADGMTARKPVQGTIARGHTVAVDTTFLPYPYTNDKDGYEAAGKELRNPIPNTAENLAEGKRMFESYCVPCHGTEGKGDGLATTMKFAFPPPPSYSTGNSSRGGAMKDLTEGKIYHTIMYGLNLMGSHASQINPDDRWKIVMYVQTLQKLETAVATADTTKK